MGKSLCVPGVDSLAECYLLKGTMNVMRAINL